MMEVRKCKMEDIPDVLDIIKEAKKYLKKHNIPQWQGEYPSTIDIQEDILNDGAYCIEYEGKLVAYSYIALFEDPNYTYIEGKWLNDEKYVVVHRTCVKECMKGQHLASLFLQKANTVALQNDVNNVRVDTHEKNTSMRKMLQNNQFQECGIIYVEDGTPRIAYQKTCH